MNNTRKKLHEVRGEDLREMGVLVIVFDGFTVLLKLGELTALEIRAAVTALLFGVVLWVLGAYDEGVQR